MATSISLKKPSPRIAEVEQAADSILSKQAREKRAQDVADLAKQRRLTALAKVELLNQPKPEKAHERKLPHEFDPAVLAGITKKLAEKHQVPDTVASQAVMKAFSGLQESWMKQELASQQTGAKQLAVSAITPSPKVPKFADVSEHAEDMVVRRKAGPSTTRSS